MAEPLFGRFHLRKGSVAGTRHKRKGINNQDFIGTHVFELEGSAVIVGVVCDGCSLQHAPKSSRNEVGASLLGHFALNEIELLLRAHVPPTELGRALYARCISYLGTIVRFSVSGDALRSWRFIETHLLATIACFVATEERLIVLSGAHDGVIILNEDIITIDQGGAPLYPAYHIVDRRILEERAPGLVLPVEFEVHSLPLAQIVRFALATDGLADLKGPLGTPKSVRPEDLEGIFKYEMSAPAGLQWHLNKRSLEGNGFEDDTSVIALVDRNLKGGVRCSSVSTGEG